MLAITNGKIDDHYPRDHRERNRAGRGRSHRRPGDRGCRPDDAEVYDASGKWCHAGTDRRSLPVGHLVRGCGMGSCGRQRDDRSDHRLIFGRWMRSTPTTLAFPDL